jgi:hypothetical protein
MRAEVNAVSLGFDSGAELSLSDENVQLICCDNCGHFKADRPLAPLKALPWYLVFHFP